MAPATDAEEDDFAGDYEDEVDQNQNYVPPLAQQPPPRRDPVLHRAKHVPLEPGKTSSSATTVVDSSVAPTTAEEEYDYAGDYEDEVDQN